MNSDSSAKSLTWGRSIVLITLSYAMALGAGVAVLVFAPIADPIMRTFLADVAATIVIFGWSMAFDNSSFYDAYWSVVPIAIIAYWIQIADPGALDARMALVFGVIFLWGNRLTFNWARGWTGLDHEDWRYVNFREQFPRFYWPISFGGIHFFPTLIVFAGLLAVWPAFGPSAQAIGWLDALGLSIGLLGIWFEWLADRQLRAFVLQRQSGGIPKSAAILRTGLWRYSRHPNYLGEILVWWSLYCFGLAAVPSGTGWAIAGPIAMTTMFLVVSIPLLEKRSLARRPGYQRVIDETSLLIPLPPRTTKDESSAA